MSSTEIGTSSSFTRSKKESVRKKDVEQFVDIEKFQLINVNHISSILIPGKQILEYTIQLDL